TDLVLNYHVQLYFARLTFCLVFKDHFILSADLFQRQYLLYHLSSWKSTVFLFALNIFFKTIGCSYSDFPNITRPTQVVNQKIAFFKIKIVFKIYFMVTLSLNWNKML
ncbi:hypothetical protein P9233_16955, partial [Schinkia azotoformans]|uniref:hypothetical protein n=1 Tax=Schinkia azotoformans TaxID=1454 RepID=UPI0030C91996